jgi:hypothetical protein
MSDRSSFDTPQAGQDPLALPWLGHRVQARRATAQASVACVLGSSPCDGCSDVQPGTSPSTRSLQRPSVDAPRIAAHRAEGRHRASGAPPEALRRTVRYTERSTVPTFGYSPASRYRFSGGLQVLISYRPPWSGPDRTQHLGPRPRPIHAQIGQAEGIMTGHGVVEMSHGKERVSYRLKYASGQSRPGAPVGLICNTQPN